VGSKQSLTIRHCWVTALWRHVRTLLCGMRVTSHWSIAYSCEQPTA